MGVDAPCPQGLGELVGHPFAYRYFTGRDDILSAVDDTLTRVLQDEATRPTHQ